LLPFLRQLELDPPGVGGIGNSADQPELRHPVHQLDGGVVPNQQEPSDIADGRGPRMDETLDAEQSLVLLRCQPGHSRRTLAECEERPQPVPKPRQRLIIDRPGGPSALGGPGCRLSLLGLRHSIVSFLARSTGWR
jgi:hypothetical protein